MPRSIALSLTLFAGACAVVLPAAAEARPSTDGVIKVCSRYGKGCVTAPTRPGQFNDRQVRLPGGTWIACKLDCRETLREESIDFFETLRERAPGHQRR
jgi:hypothetical protein